MIFLSFMDYFKFNHSITMPNIMLKQLYLKNTLMKESIRDDSKEKNATKSFVGKSNEIIIY